MRAKLSPNVVGTVQEGGGYKPETLRALAYATDTNPIRLFILAGWIMPEELERGDLTEDEAEMLSSYRRLPERSKAMLRAAAREGAGT